MSLVLNGGVNGSGSTQYAHVDSRIVTALPVTIAAWFKVGTNVDASGHLMHWMDADATLGTFRMGGSVSRSVGPLLARQIVSRGATSTPSSVQTRSSLDRTVSAITAGATTQVALDDGSSFSAGEYVRLAGDLTGLSGIVTSREYRIASVSSNTLTLEVATTGTWDVALGATLKWSAWQPEKWNLMICSFTTTNPRLRALGGFVGNSSVSILAEFAGTSAQYPADIFSVLDRICLGASFQSGSASNHFRGEAAHLAVWDGTDVTETQANELLTVAPNLVSWGAPSAYWPLLADETDSIGANDLTLVGSPTINADGPSITTSGGGGGSGYIAQVMRSRNPSIFGVR